MNNVIAIVGKPNVGKSSLFNRIVKKRIAIVDDTPGVTRDRIYGDSSWNGYNFKVIDTGGIQLKDETLQKLIQIQTEIAINEASVIIFIIDGKTILTADDYLIAKILKKTNKKIFVVANKLENEPIDFELYKIGFPEISKISAMHGLGIGDLLDSITQYLIKKPKSAHNVVKLAIIGQPNVGKSTLFNRLISDDRAIVSSLPNTTRDSLNGFFKINDNSYQIIDTAGLNKKSRLLTNIQYYSWLRAFNSLEESDITLLVIDVSKEMTHFDARIIGYANENQKPIILVLNKWDKVKKETQTMALIKKQIRTKFPFSYWIPFSFISARENKRLNLLHQIIETVNNNLKIKIKNNTLNMVVQEMVLFRPPKVLKGKVLEIKYITQIKAKIPTFILFVNNKNFLHFSYKRYLEKQFREYFSLKGVPIILKFKNN